MSGDYDWLDNNLFHESEFYIGMTFNHDGYEYVIDELIYCLPQGKPQYWSNEEHELYFGKPCNSNFDIYFRCSLIK